MPTQYPQAKHCQLFRTDIEDLLLLPKRVILCDNDASQKKDTGGVDSRIPLPTLGGALSSLLTEINVRASIQNTIVRVFIPKSKQEALLSDNPYVQLHQQLASEKEADKKEEINAGSESGASVHTRRPSQKEMFHRVGRVVALLPKPKSTNQGSHSSSIPFGEELLSSWMLAVHLGEKIELFAIKYVSNEVLSESEHLVYLHSTLGKHPTSHSTLKQSIANVTDNFILAGERVEEVKKNLKDLRAIFEAVRLYQQQINGDNSAEPMQKLLPHIRADAGVNNVSHSAGGAFLLKRARTESESDMQPDVSKRHENQGAIPQTFEEVEAEQSQYFGDQEFSKTVRLSRLSRENETLTQQLDQLRQVLQSRDENLALLHKQLRQTEEQHKSELSQWRLKELDERKSHERIVLENHTKLKENETLLQKADQKLRELAKMTIKYKSIFDEVIRRMGLKGKSPEEVLALLKNDNCPTPF